MAEKTYVNFSRPQRSDSQRSTQSMGLRKRWSLLKQQQPAETQEADSAVGIAVDEESVLTYRPAKTNVVHFQHVTSDDLDTHQPKRPSPIDELRQQPRIPERSSSHRHTITWPTYERRPGSIKFEGTPTLTRTPWEKARSQRPGSSSWSRTADRTLNQPARRNNFALLPLEVYQCIVDHIESVRTNSAGVDVFGIRQDLLALSRTDRVFYRVAREALYRDLWLPSNKTPAKRKWSRQQVKSKLRILHDTLRDQPELAFMVHRIRYTAEIAEEIQAQAYTSSRNNTALDLLRDMVACCYNLERIYGFVLPLSSTTLPFYNALGARSRLLEHAWSMSSARTELPGLQDLIYCHDHWLNLETLLIAADPGVDLGKVAISAILNRLPALKHLMVSGLDATDFNNATLLILPALKSLRLENLEGITDRGVEQLAFSRLAPCLERLKLVGLELVSLQTISTLLTYLTRLRKFALVQNTSPEAQTGVKFVERGTSFGSNSLEHLHWDCVVPGSVLKLFAEGIECNRFPNLRQVCVPCDYEGIIQALCKPIARIKLTQPDLDYVEARSHMYARNLRVAQIQAQLRVRASRQQPSVNVIVQDESNEVQMTHEFGRFLGEMSSKIEYTLEPEAGSNALACFDDVAWPGRYDGSGVERQHDLAILF